METGLADFQEWVFQKTQAEARLWSSFRRLRMSLSPHSIGQANHKSSPDWKKRKNSLYCLIQKWHVHKQRNWWHPFWRQATTTTALNCCHTATPNWLQFREYTIQCHTSKLLSNLGPCVWIISLSLVCQTPAHLLRLTFCISSSRLMSHPSSFGLLLRVEKRKETDMLQD